MGVWKKYNKDSLPPEGVEVIAFNHKWIDADFNPRGFRVGFLDGNGEFTSAFWWDNQDDYISISKSKCNENPSFFEKHIDNTEPELWTEMPNLDIK